MTSVLTWDFSRLDIRFGFVPIRDFIGENPVTFSVGSGKTRLVDGIDGFVAVFQRGQKHGILTVRILAGSNTNAIITGLELSSAQFPVDIIAPSAGLNEVIHFATGTVEGLPKEINYGPKAPAREWQIRCLGITPALLGRLGG